MPQEQPRRMSDAESHAYAEAAAEWTRKREAHAAAHPDHTIKRDPTTGGFHYCQKCHRYIDM